jgi:hypothetical protein
MKPKGILLLVLIACHFQAGTQSNLFGLGESSEGSYQLDTSTITIGGATRSAWVIVTQAPTSKAKELGANIMLVMFMMNCSKKTIGPIAWKAKNNKNEIIGRGIHGDERRRSPTAGSMDERVLKTVCGWTGPN